MDAKLDGQSKLDALRARLTGLSDMLGGEPGVAVSLSLPAHHPSRPLGRVAPAGQLPAAPSRPQHFESTVRPSSTAVLRSANYHARYAPLGGLLQKYRDAEAHWLKEKGRLTLAVKGEQQRRQKAEAELRRVQEQLAFRVGEVKHLKTALKGRDGEAQELRDRLREYELAEGGERTAAETVRQAHDERDELRSSMQELLQRLSAANDVIGQADASMASMEEQVAAAAEGRRQAEEEAAGARAEAEALRETAADLQWRCNLLQQLSDLTLRQNDEKTDTLRQLLESESMLDAAAATAERRGASPSASDDDGSL